MKVPEKDDDIWHHWTQNIDRQCESQHKTASWKLVAASRAAVGPQDLYVRRNAPFVCWQPSLSEKTVAA